MLLEIFVHTAHLDDLFKGRPVNCKINYASQYDMRLLIDPRKYVIIKSDSSNANLVTIRRKRLSDLIHIKRKR